MSERMRWKNCVAICLAGLVALAGCKKSETTNGTTTTDTAPAPTPAPSAEPIRLEQGWNAVNAEKYYYTAQGSQLIPYTWFLALEVKDGETLFRDNANMERLGYITASAPSTNNPDVLPIGFVEEAGAEPMLTSADDYGSPSPLPSTGTAGTENGQTRWLGMTCAACHTSQIHHGGKVYRIDGGPPLVDHETFVGEMAAALEATHGDEAKFNRFAKRVLGSGDASKLKTDLVAFTRSFKEAVERNKAPHPYGFGRLDAFGAIFNQVTQVGLKIPGNHALSDAPVSFPFLWGTPHLDWVQWNGSVDNPLGRNVGEVMGVYGSFTLHDEPPGSRFASSVKLRNLDWMEQQVAALSAPKWPEKDFGAIDKAKAAEGERLYKSTCKGCHFIKENGSFPMTPVNKFGKQFVRTTMVPVDTIGTDRKMVDNFLRMVDPGVMRPFLDPKIRDLPKVPAGAVLAAADGGVIVRARNELQPPITDAEFLAMNGFRDPKIGPPDPVAYKARPLEGVWATAPFLHAGSVPNLYQLLQPVKDRARTFHVGSRDFDPVDIGFSTTPSATTFEFRTHDKDGKAIPGNSNAGHEGPGHTQISDGGKNRDFTEAERRAIIEYIKTLQ